ncbi:hypothetical protein RHS01_08205 [Rhizoctonia solani]|uniref:DUF6535 domain-containing protein n=1 Tax=Rhizoctonia solani TaxID=456999 RepID=A0A8H7I9D4_9AGAM|nr:hypothetical protein RHS01_08205 [Rhizoctonia solani]
MWSQAALFSAISTAFILESTQDLKPDYAEVSAHTLAAILAAVSSGSTATALTSRPWISRVFAQTGATSSWPREQDRPWYREDVDSYDGKALSSGGCGDTERAAADDACSPVTLRDRTVAVPVGHQPSGCTTCGGDHGRSGVFYFVTLLLPLFFRYCPFTTGPMKLILPYWYKVARSTLKLVLECLGWLIVPFVAAFAIKVRLRRWAAQLSFSGCWDESKQLVPTRPPRYTYGWHYKLNAGWMIAQCENLDSVDIALQSLTCTKTWLPRVPLQKCGAFEATFMRLSTDLVAWRSISDSKGPESEKLKESVLMQSQCLSMMSHTEVIKKPDGYLDTCMSYIRSLREQLDRQWKLIDMIIKKVVDLSAADITHLVEALQSPTYMRLINKDICRMIGVALTMAYIEKHGSHSRDLTTNRTSPKSRATKTYLDLTATAPTDDRWHSCEQLLLYGLLCALPDCLESKESSDMRAVVDIMCDQERQILQLSSLRHAYLTLPQHSLITLINLVFPDMDSGTHITPPVIKTPSRTSGDVAIEMSDPPPTAGLELDKVEPSSTVKMDPNNPSSLKLAKCLLAFARDVSDLYYHQHDSAPWRPAEDTLHSAVNAIIRSNLHIHAYHTIRSQTGDLVPYCMSFLWRFTWALLCKWRYTSGLIELDIPSVLGPLRVSQGDLPDDVDGMGYTESWVEKIRLACEQSPQSVLDSKILDWMIYSYGTNSKRDHGPNTADASGCEDKVAQPVPNTNQDRQPHETPAEGANDRSAQTDAGEVAQDGEPKDGDRTHAEMQLDCLPPELL